MQAQKGQTGQTGILRGLQRQVMIRPGGMQELVIRKIVGIDQRCAILTRASSTSSKQQSHPSTALHTVKALTHSIRLHTYFSEGPSATIFSMYPLHVQVLISQRAGGSERPLLDLTEEKRTAIQGAMKNIDLNYMPQWAAAVPEQAWIRAVKSDKT